MVWRDMMDEIGPSYPPVLLYSQTISTHSHPSPPVPTRPHPSPPVHQVLCREFFPHERICLALRERLPGSLSEAHRSHASSKHAH